MARPTTVQEALPGMWRIVRAFAPYLRSQRRLIALSFLALFAEVAMRLLEPWPLKFVIDRIIVPAAEGTGVGPGLQTTAEEPMLLLALFAGAVVVVAALRALFAYASTVGFALVGNRVLTQVRSDLYHHLQSLSLAFHARSRTGDMTVRVISDVGMLKDVTVTALLPMIGNVLILLGMLTVMFILHWKLALVGLLVLPLFWLRTVKLSRKIQRVSRTQRKQEGEIAATAAEAIGSIKVVQALSLQNVFAESFEANNDRSLTEGVKAKRLEASLERSVDVLIALGTALVLWYGALLTLRAEITPGDLIVFLTYLKSAFKPVRDFAKYTGRLSKATAAGERILEVFNEKPDISDLPNAVPAPAFRGIVQLDDVSFGYEPGRTVLDNVNISAAPGQKVALVGPSGNGKSTLINLILRLYDPITGVVRIDGRDIRRFTVDSVRSQLSVVLQENLLFAATIRDNIAYGADDPSDGEIEEAARLANAHEFITLLPEGYATMVGERGVTLSGGQRQRIAIARAAIRKSPILLLDEPTAGLDEENEQAVSQALDRLAVGRTTFMVTHDLVAASRADQIVYVEGGGVLEQGSHQELLALDGRYAAMFNLQTAIYERRREAEELTDRLERSREGTIHVLAS
jgi:ATP-binding cassette subfamily B protein